MTQKSSDICPLCGGSKAEGKTTFTADLGFGVVVIRNVPATICTQCGADWLANDVSAQIEQMVQEARKKKHQVEVTLWAS
jgi:YgiT-type zinc finger domain-containing protein